MPYLGPKCRICGSNKKHNDGPVWECGSCHRVAWFIEGSRWLEGVRGEAGGKWTGPRSGGLIYDEASGAREFLPGVLKAEGGKWTSPILPPSTPPGAHGGREWSLGVGGTSPGTVPGTVPDTVPEAGPGAGPEPYDLSDIAVARRGHAAGRTYRYLDGGETGGWEVVDTVGEGVPVWSWVGRHAELMLNTRGRVADINRAMWTDPPSDREIRGACYWAGMGS